VYAGSQNPSAEADVQDGVRRTGETNVAEPELTPLRKFSISDRIFHVTAHNLKIYRSWSNSESHLETSPEFFVSISGTAVSDKDDVRIIDTDRRSGEFDLVIRSNVKSKETWGTIKARGATADLNKDQSTREHQILDLQYKIFDKSPPTATLLANGDEPQIDIKGGWSLECQIEQGILERLCTDIADRRVGAVSIAVKWTAGLIEDSVLDLRELLGATWGMLRINGRPVPLRGHISHISWGLAAEAVPTQHPSSGALSDACENWLSSFDSNRREQREAWMDRCAFSLNDQAQIIRRWCNSHGETVSGFRRMMDRAQEFTRLLDDALHDKNGPFAGERWFLWVHRNIGELYRNTNRSQRDQFVEVIFHDTVRDYLKDPSLQTAYLDWLILASLSG
jgi:hypothetical protein